MKIKKTKYIDSIQEIGKKLDLEVYYHEIPYRVDVDMAYYDYYAGDTQITILRIKNTKNNSKSCCIIDIPAPYQNEDNENVMNPILEKCLTNIPSYTPIKLIFRPRVGQRSSGNLVHYLDFFINQYKENVKTIDLQKFNLAENDPFAPTLLTLKNTYLGLKNYFYQILRQKS